MKSSAQIRANSRGVCGDELMESDWEEGFTCTLPADHEGPHIDQQAGSNRSTDDKGREYEWRYIWEYTTQTGGKS